MNNLDFKFHETSFFFHVDGDQSIQIDKKNYLSEDDHQKCSEIKNASAKSEFLNTRFLLSKIFPNEFIARTKEGRPIFPSPYNGSITHKHKHVVIAVSDSKEHIGVDLENVEITTKVQSKIAPNEDLDKLIVSSNLKPEKVLALCFSAKESIYKAVSKTLSGNITFKDVTMESIKYSGDENSRHSGVLLFSTNHKQSVLRNRQKIQVNFKEISIGNKPYLLTFTIF